MHRTFVVVLALVVGTALALAHDAPGQKGTASGATETVHGYVVDAMCAQGIIKKGNVMERAAAHTRECALEDNCAASGYGIFSDGKYLKFDPHGDKVVQELLKKSMKAKGISVEVTGKMEGKQFAVASIKETTPESKSGGEKTEGKSGTMTNHQE